MKRALVLCPGRGSYSRDSLGSLNGIKSDALDALDRHREDQNRPTPRQMDSADKFSSKLHIRGENASILTAGVSLADLDQISRQNFQVVGVIGNSMGWYTALGFAGSLPMQDCARLIETMGQYQADNVIGGQIVYPLVHENWSIDRDTLALVDGCVNKIDGLYWSIRLGGQAILGGTEDALKAATDQLPRIQRGSHEFPIRLPLHSAFHTPLMQQASDQARIDLANLQWSPPQYTMINGSGDVFRPYSTPPERVRDYTLGDQVLETFDLTRCIRVALRTVGPDVVILPGPGSNLGSAVAQSMIQEGWSGIQNRDDFVQRQNSDPILLSMRWPDQRALVINP